MAASGGSGIAGRIAFGLAALLAWFLVGRTVMFMARRWFPKKEYGPEYGDS